jgi:hypothetical protein
VLDSNDTGVVLTESFCGKCAIGLFAPDVAWHTARNDAMIRGKSVGKSAVMNQLAAIVDTDTLLL